MPSTITSKDIIRAIRRKHLYDGAVVPELTIYDDYAWAAHYNALSPEAQRYYKDPTSGDFQADPDFDAAKGKFSRRIDALLLHNQRWTALEVKVSRADFKRDTYEKRRAWMRVTHRFIYVTPVGLITKEEVPEGCGWWEVDERGRIKVSKRATVNNDRQEFPDSLIRTLFWRLSNAERKQ